MLKTMSWSTATEHTLPLRYAFFDEYTVPSKRHILFPEGNAMRLERWNRKSNDGTKSTPGSCQQRQQFWFVHLGIVVGVDRYGSAH